jgi:peptide/nickel transport system substrate-binding protein
MQRILCLLIAAGALLVTGPAVAQKSGGVLKMYFFDSPASMSIHEEATIAGQGPMMGVFNNLVMYDQHKAQTSINTIVPDLASEWSWDEDKTGLTFRLRQGVKWHDGKPFTAKDVKCTWICCKANRPTNCGSIRARRGIATLKRSSPTATTK